MTDFNQFGSAKPLRAGDPQHCAQCEAMLADALDGTLSAADQAAFDLHMIGCDACTSMLADARRGAAWMEMLKSPLPEPPADLLDRILAQTSMPASALKNESHLSTAKSTDIQAIPQNTLLGWPAASSVPGAAVPAYHTAKVLPFRERIASAFRLRSIGHTLMQPRLAMTAAMAFFSIALTLNLTGVRLSNLRASDFKPSSIKRTFYEANAHVVRYYDNLRVVYELESRVRDLQRATDTPTVQAPANPSGDNQPTDQKNSNPDQKQARPKPGNGSSRRETPARTFRQVDSAHSHGPTTPPVGKIIVASSSSTSKSMQQGGLV